MKLRINTKKNRIQIKIELPGQMVDFSDDISRVAFGHVGKRAIPGFIQQTSTSLINPFMKINSTHS